MKTSSWGPRALGLVVLLALAPAMAGGALLLVEGLIVAVQGSGSAEALSGSDLLPAVTGTVLVTLVTALAAVPLGVGAAIWLSEYAPGGARVRLVRLALRNLAGVPSIVYGLFGVAIFVYGLELGLSVISAGLTLGLLTLPTTIITAEQALDAVPDSLREASLALGASRWQTLRRCVLPLAAPGLASGALLGLARAAGETAPLLFTGVVAQAPPGGLLDPFAALPYQVYVLSTHAHPVELARPRAFLAALALMAFVGALGGAAALLRRWPAGRRAS